jgi:hypothetical protein
MLPHSSSGIVRAVTVGRETPPQNCEFSPKTRNSARIGLFLLLQTAKREQRAWHARQ